MRRAVCAVFLGTVAGLIAPWTTAAEVDMMAVAQRAKVRYSEVPRKVLAFYYPWYGNPAAKEGSGQWSHWQGVNEPGRQIASSTHYPVLGPYDSHDPKLIARHCDWAKEAGIDGLIVSWWGKGSFDDRAMPAILNACGSAGLEVTIYYETVPRKNAQNAADGILDLLDRYAGHPAWLRVAGKPVVFIYGRAVAELGLAEWLAVAAEINRRRPGGAALIGDQMSPWSARVFDGIHTYNTAGLLRAKSVEEVRAWAESTYPAWVRMAHDSARISTLTVIPGYDDTKIRKPGLNVERFDGRSYRAQWEQAILAGPHWIIVTSFNEWHEGSEIEPSAEYGEQYLKLTAEMAARFKSRPPRHAASSTPPQSAVAQDATARLCERFTGIKPALLPRPDLAVLWSLRDLPQKPRVLSWEEVAALGPSSSKQYPLLIYAGGENYRQSVDRPADVDQGLLLYLKSGGLLVVLPSGPMPLYYNERETAVNTADRLGLPLSVSGPGGGWEQAPANLGLQFVQPGRRLPHLPESFPFPPQVDPRWRPLVRSRLAEGDIVETLLELRDDQGKSYGIGAAYVEHNASEPRKARLLYVWSGLLESPWGEALMVDLLTLAAEKARP